MPKLEHPRVGDRVIIAGDGNGNSAYQAWVIEVSLEINQAVVRDDCGKNVPVTFGQIHELCPAPRGGADA